MGTTKVTGRECETTATLDEAMMLSGFGIYNILHMLMSGLGLMGMKMQCLMLGYVLPAAQCDLELPTQQKGWLSAIPFAAIILTSYFWGWCGDTQGRRSTMLYSMTGCTIMSVIASLAPELISFAVLQFLSALFLTGSSAIVYTYLGEFNNQRSRDKMVTFGSSFIGLGAICLPCLAWLILPLEFSYPIPFLNITYRSWRLMAVATAAPFALGAILLSFAPETPKFLYVTGRHEEALEVVKTIYSINKRKDRDSFPITSLTIEDATTTAYKKRSILTSMKEQTLPLLTPPLLKWILLICFVQFGMFATTNGFFIWFPTILNSLASNNATNMQICDVLEVNQIASVETATSSNTTIVCEDSIHTSTFLRSIYIGLAFFSMYIIVVVIVDWVAKKYILFTTLTITGLCGIGAHLADVQVGVILFAIFQMCGACIGLTNAVAVDLFPTKYRAMGICLSMMIGRSGSIIGSNLIGWFLEVNCSAGFFLFGGLLVVNGLTCLTLPNKKKTESTDDLPAAANVESHS